MNTLTNLIANWPAPRNVFAMTSQRTPGFSKAPFNSNNLGLHVGDNPSHVLANRLALQKALQLPEAPQWLQQTHSNLCVVVENDANRIADASVTRKPNTVLAIMTADCQPILLCNKEGNEIAAIHAGWKGLLHGVIQNTLNNMESCPDDLIAWCGPAICQNCYEVGDEVYQSFVEIYPFAAASFKKRGEKWLASLPGLTESVLKFCSIPMVYQSTICTFEHENAFFSYRREQQTGRMATLIWFTQG